MATRTKANNTTALNLTGSWVGGVVPTSVDTALWNSTVTAANTVALGANASWLGLTIANPGGNVTIGTTTATLTLGINGIDMSAASRDLTIASPVAISWVSGQPWNVAANRTLSVGSRLSGNNLSVNTLNSTMTGSVFLTGSAGAVSGTVTVSYGALYVGSFASGYPNQIETTGTTAASLSNNAVVYICGGLTYSWYGNISGSGDINVRNNSSNGVVFLGTMSSYTGSFRLYADSTEGTNVTQRVVFTNSAQFAFGNFYFLSGSGLTSLSQTLAYTGTTNLSLNTPLFIQPGSGAVTALYANDSSNGSSITNTNVVRHTNNVNATFRLAATNGPINLTKAIQQFSTGVVSLSKTGTNAATLTTQAGEDSTFTGTVSVTEGTLNANSSTALGANNAAGVSVLSGAALSLGVQANYNTGKTLALAGVGPSDGLGGNTGALIIANSGSNNTFSGGILLTGPTFIRATENGTLASNIAGGGYGFRFGAAAGKTLTYSGVISNTSSFLFGRTSLDTGTVVLSGNNTTSGAASIVWGTLSISSDANLGTAPGVATPGQVAILTNTTLATTATFALNANRGIALNGTSTINVASATTLTYAGIVANGSAGSDNLVKAGTGTLVLSGANTYGSTSISVGKLQAGNVQALGTTGTVTLTASGATLETLTAGGQNGKLTVAALTNSAGGTIKIGG